MYVLATCSILSNRKLSGKQVADTVLKEIENKYEGQPVIMKDPKSLMNHVNKYHKETHGSWEDAIDNLSCLPGNQEKNHKKTCSK